MKFLVLFASIVLIDLFVVSRVGGYFEKMAMSVLCQPCMGKTFVLEKDNIEVFRKNAMMRLL